MNKDDFINLIGSGNPVNRHMLAEISELVSAFPYFQTAHLLLLKGLRDNSDVKFENQLKNSAIHIADREILYNLLKLSPDKLISDIEKAPDIIDTGLDDRSHEPENVIVADLPDAASTEVSPPGVTDDTSVSESLVAEQPASVGEGASGTGDGEPPQAIERDEPPGDYNVISGQPLSEDFIDSEQTVIESAKNSEDLINEFEKETITDEVNKEDEEFQESTVIISQESDSEDTFSSLLIINKETGDIEEKIFYMDPGFSVGDPELLSGTEKGIEIQTDTEYVNEPDEAPVEIPGLKVSEEVQEIPEKQRQADLIDKFILSNPRIEPRKEKSDLPVEDLSKPFIEEEGGFVTETLARIYINQGYYSKAIEIYEKLSLKFPEKCGYFATQIERIKENYK